MLWKVLYFRCANVFSAACFTLRGHDIGLLWFLFLVGRICPLMQERFLRPLLKRSDRPMPGPFPAPPPKPGKGALGTTLYGPALLTFWFQTDLGRENSASYLKIQAEEDRCFSTIVTRWSRFTSNFYALIGQNLTGESMRKIYAASWNLLTLTAEADKVLCQLVMFLTLFFHWMYKMKFSCYQESSVIHG